VSSPLDHTFVLSMLTTLFNSCDTQHCKKAIFNLAFRLNFFFEFRRQFNAVG
jgi:hypothetical protein